MGTECCYKIRKKPTSKFNRKRKQVIQSSYIRIKYYNLLYKSISHPLTKKTKQKNLYKYYHTFSQNRKIRERKKKKLLYTNQKQKNNTDYSKCTHGYEKCQINSA